MLTITSFVVQNILIDIPILSKARRSKSYIYLHSWKLLLLFMVDSFHFKLYNYASRYTNLSTFFYFFNLLKSNQMFSKNIFFKSNGLITNNLTKSLIFWVLRNIYTFFTKSKSNLNSIMPTHSNYLLPIKGFALTVHQSYFKTLLFLLLNNLITMFTPPTYQFKYHTTYIFSNKNFNILSFINLFFFKTRNF